MTCQLTVRDEAGGIVHDETVRVVAYTEEEAAMSATWLSLGTLNGTVVQTLRCVDVDMEVDTVEVPLNLAPANRTSADKPSEGPKEAESDGVPTWVLVMPLFLLVLLGTALAVRSRDEEGDEGTNDVHLDVADQDALWDHESEVTSAELKRPDGWTAEQYSAWLEGPRPEGWSEDAWKDFVEEQVPLNR